MSELYIVGDWLLLSEDGKTMICPHRDCGAELQQKAILVCPKCKLEISCPIKGEIIEEIVIEISTVDPAEFPGLVSRVVAE